MAGKLLAKFNKLINFKGACAAVVAPLNPDSSVNLEMINDYTDHLISIGAEGVYINGTTGEGLSLSSDERLAVVKAWYQAIRTKKSDMLIIACVSSTVVSEILEHASLYEKMDVDAIAVLPPFYHRPETKDDLISYLQSIYKAAPSLPLLYYHYPDKTNVQLDLSTFLTEAKKRVPNLSGMKYSCKDMAAMSNIGYDLRCNKFKIFNGHPECLLPMASMGINAGVCALFSLREPVARYKALLSSFPNDLKAANEHQDGINNETTKLAGGNQLAALKKAISAETNGQVKLGGPKPPIYAD